MEKTIPSIIHLDLDALYASVEQQDQPELRGKKVIVGGNRERGVVCACSYATRPFGVRSGMAIAEALRLCPEAQVLPVRMGRYQEVSRRIFEIFAFYTDLVEPLSIDEAFLDVRGSLSLLGDALHIARSIKDEVREKTGLTLSAGLAPNKLLAKLASEKGKPDGLFMVRANEVDNFLRPLPVSCLWGVGRKTQDQLRAMGVLKVEDLRRIRLETLERVFGQSAGRHLFGMARGEDDRPVEAPGPAKSVGREETFAHDVFCRETLERELLQLADEVAARLREKGLQGRTLVLKVKYADFRTLTRRVTLAVGTSHGPDIYREVRTLFRALGDGQAVRLLGVSVGNFAGGEEQGSLFAEQGKGQQARLDEGIDKIRQRFGAGSIVPASLLTGSEKKRPD